MNYFMINYTLLISASEMTYIVSGGALNSTHSLYIVNYTYVLHKCIKFFLKPRPPQFQSGSQSHPV